MGQRQKYRVLIVDDDPGAAESARAQLSAVDDRRYEVIHALLLSAAIAALRTQKIDAVLLDLNLPDSAGIQTLRQVRIANRDIPIVVMAGDPDDEIRRLAISEGAQDVFAKADPPARQFLRSMGYVIEKWRADRKHEDLLKILSSTPDAVIVSDAHGALHFVNRAATLLFGKDEEELLAEQIAFSIPEGIVSTIDILRPDEIRTAEIRVASVDWHGERAFLASLRDMSDKHRMEVELRRTNAYLEEANRRLSEFTSLVSHDLKSPLVTILGYARLCISDLASAALPEIKDPLFRIVKAAERMERGITEIRRFSDYGGGEIEVAEIDTREIVDDMLADMRFSVEHANASVQVEDLPSAVGNATLVRQVFQNLLENAIKFRRKDVPPAIRITAAADPSWAHFRVEDNGIGVAQGAREQIFQIFKRGHKGSEFEGSGIGLAICERIVHRMGGRIWVESEPGAGSAFMFTLPRRLRIDAGPSPAR